MLSIELVQPGSIIQLGPWQKPIHAGWICSSCSATGSRRPACNNQPALRPCGGLQVHDNPTASPVDSPTQWPLR